MPGQSVASSLSAVAWKAARAGQSLPDGSIILRANYKAEKDATGKDVAGAPQSYNGMESRKGWGKDIPTLLRHFHRLMSQEITREQSAMLLLGGMRAEQRLAVFLVNVGARYAARGYSSTNFQLRMMREEIGNYLGLTIESISRLLARFKKTGLLKVANREISVLDPVRLRAIAAGTAQCNETVRQ